MVAKDKKAKKADGGSKKGRAGKARAAKPAKTADALKAMATNPLVQEVVAAALVATAAALKDTKRARALATEAGDSLEDMAREGAEKGKALWTLALEVAERAGGILTDGKKKKK